MNLGYDPMGLKRVTDARDFGRVAVLFGGSSPEREVSLRSGAAVLKALQRRGVEAEGFDPRDLPLGTLKAAGVDRVWIALHGPGGEDGTLQGALEFLGMPYTGSAVMGSAIGMDKLRTKRLAQAAGIPTPETALLRTLADCAPALEKLGLPLIVKPATQGSSVGMSKVERAEDLEPAFRAAIAVDRVVFAEAWITGAEYTVSILHRRALPSIRIETPAIFYDYQAKYHRTDTKYHCPSGLSAPAEQYMQSLALAAFDAAGAEGWGRADFMADHTGRPLLLEINTVPGMTETSLVPKAARAAGLDFDELCWQVLETSFTRQPLGAAPAKQRAR